MEVVIMGIIYNNNVEESEIRRAYGLMVYGKINRYEWTMNNQIEKALTTIRIVDAAGNDILSMTLGNNCILQRRIDDTLDNFLWWIAEDHPDTYFLKQQVYKSLCASDSLFNHNIRQRKERRQREEEEKKRNLEREKAQNAAIDSIKAYCSKNGLIPYFTYDGVYLLKTFNEKAYNAIRTADNKRMKNIIDFMQKYPDNVDGYIMKHGTLKNILKYIA